MILDLYYIIGLLIIISLYFQILNFKLIESINEWIFTFKKVSGKEPTKSDFRKKEDYNIYVKKNIYLIFESVWMVLGLVTNNWFIYVFMIFYSNLVNRFIKNRFSNLSKFLLFKILIIKLLVYSFLILNNFHLELDIWLELKKLLHTLN